MSQNNVQFLLIFQKVESKSFEMTYISFETVNVGKSYCKVFVQRPKVSNIRDP